MWLPDGYPYVARGSVLFSLLTLQAKKGSVRFFVLGDSGQVLLFRAEKPTTVLRASANARWRHRSEARRLFHAQPPAPGVAERYRNQWVASPRHPWRLQRTVGGVEAQIAGQATCCLRRSILDAGAGNKQKLTARRPKPTREPTEIPLDQCWARIYQISHAVQDALRSPESRAAHRSDMQAIQRNLRPLIPH